MPRSIKLNPTKGFSITPKEGFTLKPKSATAERGNASVFKLKNKKEFVLGPRRAPARTPKRGPTAVIQKYYDMGGMRTIEHVYARNYNRFVGTANLLAVKADGQRGWISREGRFIGEDDFRKLLYSIDKTTVGGGLELQGLGENMTGAGLVDLWDSLRPAQKAAVVDELRNMDWDRFWTEYYPRAEIRVKNGKVQRKRRPGSESWETENQFSMLDELVERIAKALGKRSHAPVAIRIRHRDRALRGRGGADRPRADLPHYGILPRRGEDVRRGGLHQAVLRRVRGHRL